MFHLGFQRPPSPTQPNLDTIADFVTSIGCSGRRTATRSLYQAAPGPVVLIHRSPWLFLSRDQHPRRVRATVPQTGNILQSSKSLGHLDASKSCYPVREVCCFEDHGSIAMAHCKDKLVTFHRDHFFRLSTALKVEVCLTKSHDFPVVFQF